MQVRMPVEDFARMIMESSKEDGQVTFEIPLDKAHEAGGLPTDSYMGIELLRRNQFRFMGSVYALSETQYLTFELLVRGHGQATFADLGERIWGDSCYPDARIRDAVRKLRNKLKSLGTGLTATTKTGIAYLSRTAI